MKSILFVIITFLAFPVLAQNDTQSPPADMQKYMEYMTPSEMHKNMAADCGTWKTKNTNYWDPANPVTIEGTATIEMILGGRYQHAHHTMDMMGQKMEGISLTAFDNARKVFMSTWIDNFGTGITYLEGPYDEATKTITLTGFMPDPMTGGKIPYKEVVKYIDANHIYIEMFMTVNGKEEKSMTVDMTR